MIIALTFFQHFVVDPTDPLLPLGGEQAVTDAEIEAQMVAGMGRGLLARSGTGQRFSRCRGADAVPGPDRSAGRCSERYRNY